MSTKYVYTLILLILFLSASLMARETGPAKISGLAFGDYYYMFSNHDAGLKNMNGLWFRRIYFTYDQGLAENFDMRLRLEMAHPGDFKSKTAAVPFVKDAYVKYTFKRTQFILGISSTPTFTFVENSWGYRSVEKTPADLYKLGSSRETGLAVKGKFGSHDQLFYHAMIGNGNGQKGETNQYKKAMLAVGSNLSNALVVEAYFDYEQHSAKETRYSYQGFMALKQNAFTGGLQFLNQVRDTQGQGKQIIGLVSAFARVRLQKQLVAFLRVDKLFNKLEDGPKISYLPLSDQSRFTLAIAGIDYALAKNVHLIPNIEVVAYEQNQISNDFMGRLTFFYSFK